MVASCISGALAVFTVSAQASEGSVSGEVLSLLQTQVHKRDATIVGGELADIEDASIADFLSVHSDKDCKTATKEHKDAKKQAKADRAAIKAARAALKSAIATAEQSKQVEADTLAKMGEMCPVPEVDRSPDVGCSKTLVTSHIMTAGQQAYQPELLEKGLPTRQGGWYGFEGDIVPGGGIAKGRGTDMGSKLGTAVMQPCSVAWTVGEVMPGPSPQHKFAVVDHKTGKDRHTGEQVWIHKMGLATACACREWAETVMKWPEAVAVEFKGQKNGGGYLPYEQSTICRVWALPKLPWPKTNLGLQLRQGANTGFTCYLGNPEEYKEKLANEKALGHTIDRCSKTSLWSAGIPNKNFASHNVAGGDWYTIGQLRSPDPPGNSQAGRKLCLKWAKNDPKCANATILSLSGQDGTCMCYESIDYINQLAMNYEPTADHGIGQTHQVCQF